MTLIKAGVLYDRGNGLLVHGNSGNGNVSRGFLDGKQAIFAVVNTPR